MFVYLKMSRASHSCVTLYNTYILSLICLTISVWANHTHVPAAVSCWGRNSCMSWMSLARSWLSLAMLQISSWLKSGWICLHNSIWLMTLPMFDGPARFSAGKSKNDTWKRYNYCLTTIMRLPRYHGSTWTVPAAVTRPAGRSFRHGHIRGRRKKNMFLFDYYLHVW